MMNNSESGDGQTLSDLQRVSLDKDGGGLDLQKQSKPSNEATMRASIMASLLAKGIDAKTASIMAASQVSKMTAGREEIGVSASEVDRVIEASDQPGGDD
jgi:hypothetical protein